MASLEEKISGATSDDAMDTEETNAHPKCFDSTGKEIRKSSKTKIKNRVSDTGDNNGMGDSINALRRQLVKLRLVAQHPTMRWARTSLTHIARTIW